MVNQIYSAKMKKLDCSIKSTSLGAVQNDKRNGQAYQNTTYLESVFSKDYRIM